MPLNNSYDEQAVIQAIASALETFYGTLIEKIDGLNIQKVMKRKNPYLYRAKAMQSATEIVDSVLTAFVSSSEETIFGNCFFEPIAIAASGGNKALAEGIDIMIQKNETNTISAIAVKSGPSVFNADSKKRQEQNFTAASKLAQQAKARYEAYIGYCYGKKKESGRGKPKMYQELAGKRFWTELTGDEDFYIKIIGYMGTMPEKIQLGQILNCANNSESDNVVWVSDTADLVDTYCFMDDNKRPYNISECVEVAKLNTSILSLDGFEVEYMMVPLYKRMILEAADAYDICMSVIASPKFGIKSFSQEWDSETKKQLLGSIDHELGTKEEPLVIRLFMASSRTFRKKRDTQFNVDNKEIQDYYNMTVFPKFVWVCEISSKALYENQQVLGEIIIDATSSPDAKMDSIIIVNYPYALCRRMPEDFLKASEACFEEVKEWKPYDIFRGNLTDCQSL